MEGLHEYIEGCRTQILRELDVFLGAKRTELAAVSDLGPEACEKLAEFASRGKMIRGALLYWAASLGRTDPRVAASAAAAMELFQSALLIHDDIMDRDTRRRGGPSMHQQYVEQARLNGSSDPPHLGEAQGISVGDIAFFMAFELLSLLPLEASSRTRLVALFARELSLVGVAQMVDMATAASQQGQRVEEILKLYLYKTGRYTFSLPLAAGAILGSLDASRCTAFEQVGQLLGMLFQIRDDELGLYGDPEELGKPVGSDIREGKKTIFHAALLQHAPPEQLERIRELWGSPELRQTDVTFVLDAMERSGARAYVHGIARDLAERARPLAEGEGAGLLTEMLSYSVARLR